MRTASVFPRPVGTTNSLWEDQSRAYLSWYGKIVWSVTRKRIPGTIRSDKFRTLYPSPPIMLRRSAHDYERSAARLLLYFSNSSRRRGHTRVSAHWRRNADANVKSRPYHASLRSSKWHVRLYLRGFESRQPEPESK